MENLENTISYRGLVCGLCSDQECTGCKEPINKNDKCAKEICIKEQRSKWKCNCGIPFSWYEKNCNNCGSSLVSYGTNLIENKDK